MIIGYLLPNDDIYTLKWKPKGKFEIEEDEKIVLKAKNILINVAKYGWGTFFQLSNALDEGYGRIIKTNKRLIYYREIDPYSRNRFWDLAPYAIKEILKAKKLKKKGIREYFEVNFNEIIGFDECKIPFLSGLEIYGCKSRNQNGKTLKKYFSIIFRKRYQIIDDPLILKKELSKAEVKEMKKEEKEYWKKIRR